VYVLDVGKQTCAGILYTGHASGWLRGEPVVVPPPGDEAPALLVLAQADGLAAVKLRAFALPVSDPDARPLGAEPKLRGWSWLPPGQDGELAGLATDAGVLGLLGLGQPGNRDPVLSPWLKGETRFATAAASGRAQLVHADGHSFWVQAPGGLYRLRRGFGRPDGPMLVGGRVELQPRPVPLGAPLHA